MNPQEALIHQFYNAFQQSDYATMQQAYHPNAHFYDPVFQHLNSAEVKAMWQMLLTSATDLKISFHDVRANEIVSSCRWEARYTFSVTGRPVHNSVQASFEFKDGKILHHHDAFDFWRWSRQALGVSGLLLGWSPFIQNKVRHTARRKLEKFMQTQGVPSVNR